MPPVIFLHGFMGNLEDWRGITDGLKDSFCCLLVDLPGHGKSLHVSDDTYTFPGAARSIAKTVEVAGVGPAAIVGYSMGGRVALYLAIHFRRLCSALICESASPGIVEEKQRENRKVLDATCAYTLEEGEFEDFLRTWYSQPVFASLTRMPETLEKIIRRRRLNDPAKLAKALLGFSVGVQAPLWEHLSRLDVPVLLLAGEQDSKYIAIIKQMDSLLRGADVQIVPEVGHNIHEENPSGFLERIRVFLLKE